MSKPLTVPVAAEPPADLRIPVKDKTAARLLALSNAAQLAVQRYEDAVRTILDEHDVVSGTVIAITDHAPFELIVRLPAT